MLTLFGKKKLTEEKAATIFVNAIQVMIDDGFETVASLINDSPEFKVRPSVGEESLGAFALVVLSANVHNIPLHFDAGQDKRIIEHILQQFAEVYELDKMELARLIAETRQLMSKKNHPSKVMSSAMAKTLFCRFGLNRYQEDYFKSLGAPNPIFLQRLKEAMETFLWDWNTFLQRHKLV